MFGTCPVYVRYLSATCSVIYRTKTEHQVYFYRTKSEANSLLHYGYTKGKGSMDMENILTLAHPTQIMSRPYSQQLLTATRGNIISLVRQ